MRSDGILSSQNTGNGHNLADAMVGRVILNAPLRVKLAERGVGKSQNLRISMVKYAIIRATRGKQMPRLMEKKDWIQTVANVDAAESVWYENISSDGDAVPLPLPGRGTYQVILVKINAPQQSAKKSKVRIGSKKGVWRIPTEEEDRAMDEEIVASMSLDDQSL